MKSLKVIWEDVKSGRNIDIYITVVIAFAIALLDIFGIVNQSVISSATLAVLALVAYSLLQDRRKNQFPVVISSSNEGNNQRLLDYIKTNKVVCAKLIQYSGHMIQPVLVELLERGAKVELLLQSPNKALNEQQCGKFVAFHESITADDFRNKQNLTIRYFSEPASIRAVKLDDVFLAIGWYTYRNVDETKGEPWLYGHNNAVISGWLHHVEMHDLASTFDIQFQTLWKSATSLTINEIKAIVEKRRKELKKIG
jgi:hypothetical protein